jgi:hypothetical protein
MGRPSLKECVCPVCGKNFRRSLVNNVPKIVCCSVACAAIVKRESMKGAQNPNFGKSWPEDRRKRQSEIIKATVDEEYRRKAGSANKGKKFSKERCEKMHAHRPFSSYSRQPSEETKARIGLGSKEKWQRPGYKERYREAMQSRGWWVPQSQKSDYEVYSSEAAWVEKMFDLPKSDEEEQILTSLGVFSPFSNPGGVVRDHIFSRMSGLRMGVFPELMRHPANCQIITHAANAQKRSENGMTLEELLCKIVSYRHSWREQDRCLELVAAYRAGARYERKECS